MVRTVFGKPLITAMPPALSVIGPKASSEIMMPDIESIAMTATAMPYRPAALWLSQIDAAMQSTGKAVA